MKSVSVSLLGDEAYRNALAVVARRQNKNVGALVREALDVCYGGEIAKELPFFARLIDLKQSSSGENNNV